MSLRQRGLTDSRVRATPTGDIENANLAEDDAVSERSEHGHAVVRDDRQPAALDDVQLLPDVALTADLRLPSQPASAATAPWPVLISVVVVLVLVLQNGLAYITAHYPSCGGQE